MTDPQDPITESELQAYHDGRLDPARVPAAKAYLAANPEVEREIETWRANDEALAALLDPYRYGSDDDLVARPAAGRGPTRWAGLVAAIVLAFGLGGGAGYLVRDMGVSTPAFSVADGAWLDRAARDVFLTYVREVRHPVEVAADERDHLVSWLGNRIERPFTAPGLEPLGFALVGGRLLPIGGRPGAMLMYEDAQGNRATLLLARSGGVRDTAFQFSADDGVNTFRWVDGPLAYTISGFLERGDLETISRAVYAHFETI